MKWQSFEDRVRETAQHIWGRPCHPRRVGGVNLDGHLKLADEWEIFVEMTENRTLAKVREDVTKLITARMAAFTKGVSASLLLRCEWRRYSGNDRRRKGPEHTCRLSGRILEVAFRF